VALLVQISSISAKLRMIAASDQLAPSLALRSKQGERPLPKVGAWELVRCVGSGRWSRVYQARPAGSGANAPADYALKLMRSDDQQPLPPLLERELEVAAEVSHPHLVSVLAAHLDQPKFLVTPWVAGASLRQLISRGYLPPIPRALWFIRQAAEALAALHAAGWIHGDIKPENILVDHRAHVTLIDLGLAQRIRMASEVGPQPFFGSPEYAAPELFTVRHAVTPASDAFSLGVTLFELLTGERPNWSVVPVTTGNSSPPLSTSDPRRIMPQIPQRVARLVRRLLANEPLRRPLPDDDLQQLLREAEVESFDNRQPLVRTCELASEPGE